MFFHRRLFVFQHDISQTDAARTTKLDTNKFYHNSWKFIYFGVKRSKVKVKKVPACVYALSRVLASSSLLLFFQGQ